MTPAQSEPPTQPDPGKGESDVRNPRAPDFMLGAGLNFANPHSPLAFLYPHTTGALTTVFLALGWQVELDRWQVQFVVVEPAINPGLVRSVLDSQERWEVVPNMGATFVARRTAVVRH